MVDRSAAADHILSQMTSVRRRRGILLIPGCLSAAFDDATYRDMSRRFLFVSRRIRLNVVVTFMMGRKALRCGRTMLDLSRCGR